MTPGDKAYNILLDAESVLQRLWAASKEGPMHPKDIEVCRNYVSSIGEMRKRWEQERARWQDA